MRFVSYVLSKAVLLQPKFKNILFPKSRPQHGRDSNPEVNVIRNVSAISIRRFDDFDFILCLGVMSSFEVDDSFVHIDFKPSVSAPIAHAFPAPQTFHVMVTPFQ